MIANCSGTLYLLFHFFVDTGESQPLPWYIYTAYVLELIVMVFSSAMTIFIYWLLYKMPVCHQNLRIIFAFQYSAHIFAHIIRFMDIYGEFFGDLKDGDCHILDIIRSFLRLMGTFTYAHCPLAFLVERSFVLIYLNDYEKKRRLFIPVIIILDVTLFSCLLAYFAGTGTLLLTFVAAYLALMGIATITLSKNIFICLFTSMVTLLGLLLSAYFTNFNLVLVMLFELTFTCAPMVQMIVAVLTIEKWRTFLYAKLCGKSVTSSEEVDKKKESELYFKQLADSWAMKAP